MAKKKTEKESPFVPVEEQPYRVPENWCWIRLLFAFDNKTDSKKKLPLKEYAENGEIPIIDQGKELIGGYTDKIELSYGGDLPVVVFGDHTRCIKFIDFDFVQGADGIKVLVPKRCWNRKAFYYAFQSVDIPNMGYRRHFPLFGHFSIPLPPINEQRRIVDRIESLFAKLDEAKGKAQEALEGFEERHSAILKSAFSGKLTESWRKEHGKSFGWKIVRFDEVAYIRSNLVEPSEFKKMPHIAPDNIEKKTGKLLEYHTIEEDGVTSGKHHFYPGQILYSKIRPYLSKVVLVDFEGLCSADMYPIEAIGNAKLLWYQMLSDDFLVQASTAGSRSVLPKINQKELSALKVNVTSDKEEETEVVRILDDFFAKEAEAREKVESALDAIETMKKSILAKAFRGELGTNNPEDESAEELLMRTLA